MSAADEDPTFARQYAIVTPPDFVDVNSPSRRSINRHQIDRLVLPPTLQNFAFFRKLKTNTQKQEAGLIVSRQCNQAQGNSEIDPSNHWRTIKKF